MTRAAHVTRFATIFGQVLGHYRRAKRWSLVKLSQRTGMNVSHLSVLESGQNIPSISTIFLLGEVLGFRPSELLRQVEERLGMKD
jgi:transcriptional regulator with XRE-family HTH domain